MNDLTTATLAASESSASAAGDPSNLIVVLMGICVVFIGLVCIIALIELMTLICNAFFKEKKPKTKEAPVSAPAASSDVIENREELVAAVCAAVAEELGTDISALRVVSFKKI